MMHAPGGRFCIPGFLLRGLESLEAPPASSVRLSPEKEHGFPRPLVEPAAGLFTPCQGTGWRERGER